METEFPEQMAELPPATPDALLARLDETAVVPCPSLGLSFHVGRVEVADRLKLLELAEQVEIGKQQAELTEAQQKNTMRFAVELLAYSIVDHEDPTRRPFNTEPGRRMLSRVGPDELFPMMEEAMRVSGMDKDMPAAGDEKKSDGLTTPT